MPRKKSEFKPLTEREVIKRNPGEVEFHQAVQEVKMSLKN